MIQSMNDELDLSQPSSFNVKVSPGIFCDIVENSSGLCLARPSLFRAGHYLPNQTQCCPGWAARPVSLPGPGSTVAVSAELRSSVQILSEVENRNLVQL